jgi:hypothetical protein
MAQRLMRRSTSSSATPLGASVSYAASFGVGTGRFDDVVLVRFEDDTPYALGPAEATALGEALIDQAELVGARPVRVRQ